MRGASSGESNLVSSFSNISGINSLEKLGSKKSAGISARKQLPNKLRLNVEDVDRHKSKKPFSLMCNSPLQYFSSLFIESSLQTYRNKHIMAKEMTVTDTDSSNLRSPYMADIAIRGTNNNDSKNKKLRIVAEELRQQNKTSQLPSPSNTSPLGGL